MSIRTRVQQHIDGNVGHHTAETISSALGDVTIEQVKAALLVLAYRDHLVRRVRRGIFERLT